MKLLIVACLVVGIHGFTINGAPSPPEEPGVAVSQDCVALAAEGKCEFYDCFFERYRCHNFLLADAKPICVKLYDRMDRLTEPAKKWVQESQICIQNVLLQNYTSDTPMDCAAFRQYGFTQHKKCVLDKNVCDIFWDNKFTLMGVLDPHNLSHLAHTASVLMKCTSNEIASQVQRLMSLRQYLPALFQ